MDSTGFEIPQVYLDMFESNFAGFDMTGGDK